MIKIQIIIDQDGELTGLTCGELTIEHPTPNYSFRSTPMLSPNEFRFTASRVVKDDSPNLISLPDELLLRIRDHNIDEEHKNAIKQTVELKDQIESLKGQVYGWELRRDLVMEEWEQYHRAIDKIIDKHPEVAAEVVGVHTNKICQSEEDHQWECCGMSTVGSSYICKKCYEYKTVPYQTSSLKTHLTKEEEK